MSWRRHRDERRRERAKFSRRELAQTNYRVMAILVASIAMATMALARSSFAQTGRPDDFTAPVNTNDDWNGWYAGGHVGYSGGNGSSSLSNAARTASRIGFGRLDGGLQAGYNRVLFSRLVLGAEADISFPYFFEDGAVSSVGTPQTGTVTEKTDFVSTLRGRLGYTFDRWLIYGTGGFAPSEASFIETPASLSGQDNILRWRMGWALGAGAEFVIARGWTARVEYLYDELGQAGVVFPSGTRVESKSEVHGLRLGLSRALSWPRTDARSTPTDAPSSGTNSPVADEDDSVEHPRPGHPGRTGLLPLPIALRGSEQSLRRESGEKHRERDGVPRRAIVGRRCIVLQPGDRPGLWAQ